MTRRICSVLLLGALGGCAGAHLYNPEKVELAQQGKKGIDSLDFSAFMAAEDKNIAAYDEAERRSWHANELLKRDLMLARMTQSSLPFHEAWIGPASDLGQHVAKLAGKPASIEELGKVGEELGAAEVTIRSNLDGVRERAVEFDRNGLSLPPCNPASGASIPARTEAVTSKIQAATGGTEKAADLLEVYDSARELCDAAQKQFEGAMCELAPATRSICSELADARSDLAGAEKIRSEISNKFDDAVREIEQAAPGARGKKPSQIAGPALAALHEAIGQGAGLAGSIKGLEVSEKRLQKLDALLDAAATGSLDDPNLTEEQRKLAVAIGGLPNLADSFYDLAGSVDSVPRYALLIVREQVRAERDRAAAQVQRAQRRVELLQAKLDTQVREFRRYVEAARYYGDAKDKDSEGRLKQKPAVALSGESPAPVRERARVAVAWSAFAWNSAETQMADYDAALFRLEYERRQSDSRIALAEWKGMLVALADSQVGYHETGITPEQWSALAVQLLQAAGLFAIAAGVQ
jgi:hypothetical protein